MPRAALVIFGLIVLLVLSFWLVGTVLALLFRLAIAGLIGAVADMIVPGRLPYGLLGAVAAGLLGGLIGELLLGGLGPNFFPFNLLKTLVGAVIVVAVATWVYESMGRRRRV